ncbi:MAG: flagellar biosynthesis protein FlhB [Myxococcota bacterium]
MADGSTGEKTEEPTPERLRKLRKEGNVPKSQDVPSAAGFLAVFSVLAATTGFLGEELIAYLLNTIKILETPGDYVLIDSAVMYEGMWLMFKLSAPALMTELVVKVGLTIAQTGFLFTTKPLVPDIKRLNPITGFKNLFNKKKLVELLKTTVKFIIVSWVAYIALKDAVRDLVMTTRSELTVGLTVVGRIIWDMTIKIGGAFVIIAAFDAFYQRKRYMKENMMSKYDVKQEYKQSEGDPQHKAERRRFHQEILNSSGPAAVKGADAVVRNPDHIAVAIKYDKEKGNAPTVVAKGTRIWAEKILDAAKQFGVPVIRNVPLAQALNKLDIGDEVPEDLYEAVAEVLNFVYNLAEEQKRKNKRG